jgi:sugar lactone lactonase YvrE
VVCDGLAFTEGPRWHDSRLWFSDMHGLTVCAVDAATGALEEVVGVAGRPSGLGWTPDGRLLIVSMDDRRMLGWRAGEDLTEVADLSSFTAHPINDMVVAADGRAYVGGFGFDFHAAGALTASPLYTVAPDGTVGVAADDLLFPNGMVITPDATTLIVGESFGARLTAFTIDATTGALRDRRVFADLSTAGAGVTPDGICLDADGCVWAASPGTRSCVRVREGGEVVGEVSTGDYLCVACMLGGPDRRTLFLCTSLGLDPDKCAEMRSARIESVVVDVPGAGLP